MKKPVLMVAAIAAFAPAALPARQAGGETITYRSGPCMGGCPIFEVTVRSDGTGIFEGINFTAVRGTRSFRVTPPMWRAFANHLSPLRPRSGSVDYRGERCRDMVTDMPSATVTWTGWRGTQRLHFYYGCDVERNRALARRLGSAPDQLPIGDFIGRSR